MPTPTYDFRHPADRAALDALKAIPLLTQCVQAFMKVLPERVIHGLNMAEKVRLGPKQLPHIYRHLPPVCDRLGIEEPEFYLEMDPNPNAYTYGDKQASVTVTSGLIESMEEREVRAIVAHECGHIACRHVLYRTMAIMLLHFGSRVFGPLSAASLPVQLALLYWFRRSEFSADRAAAAVMGEGRIVADGMIRLAGGSKAITGGINFDLYMEQAADYDKLMDSKWDHFLQGLATAARTHPMLAVRTREVMQWTASEDFQAALLAVGRPDDTDRCAGCGHRFDPDTARCSHCDARRPIPMPGLGGWN